MLGHKNFLLISRSWQSSPARQIAQPVYVDLAVRIMRLLPGANEEQTHLATSREFMERLLRAKDFQEALGIQVEHFQSQLTAAAEEATQIGAWIVGLANLPRRFFG